MKQIKIGAITIGQAPRTDITRDILPLLPDYMTLTEYGALDDMTYEEVMSQFAPSEDDEVLVGIPSFACTPDLFPGMMAAAIRKEDVNLWAAKQGIVVSKG